ncbi:ParA family protein [Inconstantimicrobium mannanitabidum]|uniref:Sporulation initiation inhibitor Soj n=1 Tax=Inconstantimicrobium mannanitabidum TaxID=1604901 RepID=A0ACB5RIT5_9CLOT|nr:AAA family ATPase [Clostridium sp. TW13]GKX68999.1 sporulation initiation inhibitor Soj [Clostridium sp. TW13]
MKTIAIFNQKGGCSKTSTCSNLAAALSLKNKKVLLVDCDPQSNLTSSVGIDDETLESTIYTLLTSRDISYESINKVILPTTYKNLSIIPSDITLSDAEISLSNTMSRETILKRILAKVKDEYDFILLDCPPSLGLLSLNALCAADDIIIPVSPDFFSLKGIKHLLSTIDAVQSTINPDLKILGVLLTKYDSRKNLAKNIQEILRENFGDSVFNTLIRIDSQIEYSQDNMTPVVFYNHKAKSSEDYTNLAAEVLKNVK